MPELDGIRGLAILGVLCSHLAGLGGIVNNTYPTVAEKLLLHLAVPMWGGVDLFFVLSGFLITGILLRTKTSPHYFKSFYARRVLRIFPIYYLVLTLSLIAGRFSSSFAAELPPWTSWKVAYFLYLQNWPVFWHGEKAMRSIWGAYWSLAVEEQFYFIWPLAVLLLAPRTLMKICYIALPCALALRIYLYQSYFGDHVGLLQLTSSRIDGLLLGAICSIYMSLHHRPVPMRWVVASAASGFCVLAYIAIFQRQELVATAGWIGTIGVLGFALLSTALVAISQHQLPVVQRILTMKWLRLAGKYSYGMYVYHLFFLIGLRRWMGQSVDGQSLGIHHNLAVKILVMAAEMVVVFLVAKLSFDLFESRVLRLKRYFKPA